MFFFNRFTCTWRSAVDVQFRSLFYWWESSKYQFNHINFFLFEIKLSTQSCSQSHSSFEKNNHKYKLDSNSHLEEKVKAGKLSIWKVEFKLLNLIIVFKT